MSSKRQTHAKDGLDLVCIGGAQFMLLSKTICGCKLERVAAVVIHFNLFLSI